jgi:hypothetical protein
LCIVLDSQVQLSHPHLVVLDLFLQGLYILLVVELHLSEDILMLPLDLFNEGLMRLGELVDEHLIQAPAATPA